MSAKIGIFTAISSIFLIMGCSGSNNGSTVSPPALDDPALEFEVPGEYGCDGCPDTNIEDFIRQTSTSSLPFSDIVSDAVGNGKFYIVSDDGAAVSGAIPTDSNGAFSFNAPLFCGVQIVKCVWSNEVGSYVLVTEVTRDDCVDADIQLTLNWDDLGRDYELHLIKPGGTINDNETDCTWTSCIGQSPDWGVAGDASDNPVKDVDNTGQYGPENIYLSNPEVGTYTVIVEHWGGGSPESDGELIFNVAGKTTVATTTDLPSHYIWNVGTIDWPSGDVTLDGSTLDCNDNWSSGCTLPLPQAGTL